LFVIIDSQRKPGIGCGRKQPEQLEGGAARQSSCKLFRNMSTLKDVARLIVTIKLQVLIVRVAVFNSHLFILS
jgi:hypothetical protein